MRLRHVGAGLCVCSLRVGLLLGRDGRSFQLWGEALFRNWDRRTRDGQHQGKPLELHIKTEKTFTFVALTLGPLSLLLFTLREKQNASIHLFDASRRRRKMKDAAELT